MAVVTTAEVIEQLVKIVHGNSPKKLQDQYRDNLQLLVELTKLEQRRDAEMEFPADERRVIRRITH